MGQETNPVAEVSVEDRLAAAFEKAGIKDDPVADTDPEDHQAEESEVPAEAEDESEAQAQADEPADDAEEVEFEGEVFALPKKLKDAVLRQKDYTQKTQQVADLRRQIEVQAEAVKAEAEFQKAHFEKAVQAHALNTQLQQFAQIPWAQLAQEDPGRYLQLDRQQRELQEAAYRVNAELQQAGQKFQEERGQLKQKAQAKCIEELKRDFKDFGPDLLRTLDETGKSFGFSGEELAQVTDPRMIRVLHAAAQYKKLQGSKALVDKKVENARPVQVKVSRTAQSSKANADLKAAKDRMLKTGKTADTENYLASLFAKKMR